VLIGQIAVGANEQSIGVQQVGTAAQELDRTTQSNAALVEQTAAAAASLRDRAAALAGRVSAFRLPVESPASAGVATAPAPAIFDFDQAIEAHRAWKVKLRSAMSKHEQLDAASICRDDRCPLGQWLHGAGGQRWGTHPAFTQLIARHAEFHKAAGEVARAVNQGAYAQAEQLLGSGSHFATVSTETVTDIMRAKRDLH
jgi:methyl-accepting chemotaxis protein